MATNGNVNHLEYAAPAQTSEAPANADNSTSNLPKDEVGWYFVEQYYTTLSKSPERLHLFYGKKSQFVSGLEAAIVSVSVGRQAIQDRIKEMDFQDCKVRISNVDSQGSDQNIVIQVIGEIANKGDEPKKFVQTFVLAQQPSGYFVLNDILRYIDEDQEEAVEEAAEPAAPVEPSVGVESEAKAEVHATEEATPEKESAEPDIAAVVEKLEEAAVEPPAAAPAAATTAETEPAVEPATKTQTQTQPDVEKTIEEIAEEEVKKPEEPKDPNPTPAVAQTTTRVAAAAPAQPEKPREPPKPMSWASRVAAGAPRPVVPIPKAATPPAAAQPRAPVPAATQQPAPPTQQPENPPAAAHAAAPAKDQGNEWQTAETKRQSRAQAASAAPSEKEGTMAYIKYVTDKVKDEDLKATLSAFGELAYFDINRQKNCAFVEFKTQAGYNAAVAANPHTVNGENILVEQRRPKANAYGGTNYNAARGGAGGRSSRGGYEPSRSGAQGGRGGFTGQSRGRGGAPRGRGAAQAGAA
ncbi:putative G3BP-like protein [Madurella mycetomatis]|uniref:G3BP-like protein n=1 Tax=Madurella mycetomatis TaxID=100816 RepID=A0A175VQY0_9PEZI|nr:putative G3BP-like protein [Madurella mycetomatis]